MKLEDNICPICLYIFIQPVTMPCDHELCLTCFKQNVEEANFCCPMCRTRISTWARRAARTKSLVNLERWEKIQLHFPEQVQKRLRGEEEEDPEMNALNISIRLAEPGEIRNEYEQQLKTLQEQRAEERRKEQEASERLIRELQQEEERRRAEQEALQHQDEELAKQLSQVDSPGADPEIRTRSGASGSTTSRPSSNMDNFLGKLQPEDPRSPSPYPYRCLTPVGATGKLCVDKTKAKQMEEQFLKKKIKKDRNLITTSDIERLEETFTRNCRSKTASATSVAIPDNLQTTGTKASVSPTLTNAMSTASLHPSEVLDQMSADVCINLVEDDSSNSNIIRISDSPTLQTKTADPDTGQQRSSSAHSMDSITQELNHFRPIRSCPLTPPRRLPSGIVIEPKLIRTTPRNLGSGFTSPVEANLSDIDAGSPVMQRRLSQLSDERKDKVEKMSKSTSTTQVVSPDENLNPEHKTSKSHTHLMFSHVGNRNAELKDISNSPLTTQNPGRKLIIPLEPDLEDIGDGEWMDMSGTFCPVKIEKISPIDIPSTTNPKSRRLLSRSQNKGKSKVKYTADVTQSPLLKWMKKNDSACLNHGKNGDGIVGNSRDEVDGEKQRAHRISGNTGTAALDNLLAKESNDNSAKRSRRAHRMYKDPDYVYEGCPNVKNNEDGDSSDSESDLSVLNAPKKRKNSANSNSPRKKIKTKNVTSNKSSARQKRSLKSTKQSAKSKKLAQSRQTQQKAKPAKTLHDFFHNVEDSDEDRNSDSEESDIDQEERDRRLALELQKQFEMEAKFHLNALRFKGTTEEYSLRRNRKSKTINDA